MPVTIKMMKHDLAMNAKFLQSFKNEAQILFFGRACPFGSKNFLTGTPFYISPEQVQCFLVDQRSDIYSLGLVACEMLTGKRPFEGEDQWKVMELRANNEIPDPAALIPDLPITLRDFILKACARNPCDRYQNIPEALETIGSLLRDYGLTNGQPFKTKRNVRMFYLVYSDEQKNGLRSTMDEFNAKVKSLGIELKAGESIDLRINT